MFIYKFMGGLVDAITGEQNDDKFDPHEKRKVEKPTTYGETMTHMLKGSIGAGILAMPEAIRGVGVIYGVIGAIAIGMFACYCLQLLIRAQYQICKRWKRGYMAYPKSMKLAIQDGPKFMRWSGKMFYVLVDSMLVIWQLGICTIYFVFVGANVGQVLENYGIVMNIRIMIVCELPLQIILNMIKNLKLLTPLSSFSNGLTIFALLMVFFYLIEDDVHIDEEKLKIKSLESIPTFVGTTLFALEAVGVVLALEYNMEKPSRFTGIFGLMSVGFVIIISLFVSLGAAGYLKYGESIKASVTLNLPPSEKKAQIAKLAYALALYLSIPLQNFVAYEILLRKLKKKLKPDNVNILDYSLRIILVIIPFAFAVAAPKLGPFISLLGALCLSLVAVTFPAIMDVCVWYPDKYGFLNYKLLRDIVIILLSLFCLISGVYTSLLEFAASEDSYEATPSSSTTTTAPNLL